MADYSPYIKLELPKSIEKYNVAVANKNNMVIDSELHKLELKSQKQDDLLATKEALNQEILRATNAENNIFENLSSEIERAKSAENVNSDNILEETTRALSAEEIISISLQEHISDKANPHNITKEQLGIGNVDNTLDIDKPVSTAQQNALDSALSTHNTSEASHSDMRLLISGLTTRLNALADSDDTTLDQLSEIVAYIKNNKSLIDSITTSKVNVSDIVDDLTSSVTDKPISAKQGVILKGLITDLTALVGNKVDKISGKGLSTNDYTTEEKSKLNDIATGAEVNVQADWNVTDNTSDAFIKNKPSSLPASDVSEWAKSDTKPSYSKSEVGLGNVPNVATNDQTPTFTQASSRTNIVSKEKLSTLFGKIMKWFADLKTVAFTGSYNDLSDKPTIPSVGNGIIATKEAVESNTELGKLVDALVIKEVFQSVSDGKTLIASAITDKGVETDAADSFSTMAENIGMIETGGTLPENVRNISLSANPVTGGTVYGGGVVSDSMTITIRAEVNEDENYNFEGWKENGSIVSSDLSYTFLVSEDRSLTAKFFESQYVIGVDWWGTFLPSSARWRSVTYGDGKFVAIVYGSNKAAYSTDGITWTECTIISGNWRSITYGDGKFVAVAYNSNKAAYSTDGITWKATTLPSSEYWYSVTYGDGRFVAVSDGGKASAYSTDGITWTASTIPSDGHWESIAYGGGVFISPYYGGNRAACSNDGITWVVISLPSYENWRSITYGDGKFITVAYNSNKAAYSTDGFTWTATTLPSSAGWFSVVYGDGMFVAVSTDSNKAAYSTDGITWTAAILPYDNYWFSVTYGDGKFVAVANNSNVVAYSSAKGEGK